VNHIELLDRLFAARRELSRIIVATANAQVSPGSVQDLLTVRDQLNVQIQTVILGDLSAATADLQTACDKIDAATAKLEKVTEVAQQIDKAVKLAQQIIDAAGVVLAIV
jgi:hypothetical protein